MEEQREHTRRIERAKGAIIPHVWHRNGRQIQSIRVVWTTACKKAGVPDAWIHDLRRSAVRNMESAGVPRSVAMKLSGHITESIYLRYAIAEKSAMEEGVAKLARLHAGDSAEQEEAAQITPIEEARKA